MALELRGETNPKSTESLPKTSEVSARKPLESPRALDSRGVISRSLTGRMTMKEAACAGIQRRVARAAFRPGVKRDQGTAEIQAKLDVPASTSGQPMPEAVQQKMESAFSADFSGVRIHAGSARAVALGALAYTQGSDIHVAPGRWAPETMPGQELLGHELAHVQQQRAGRVRATAQMKGVALNDDPALEREADESAHKAAQGGMDPAQRRTGAEGCGGAIQRAAVWARRPEGDAKLDAFVTKLDTIVNQMAKSTLEYPLAIPDVDGYTARWKLVVKSFASKLNSTQNLTDALAEVPFIYTAYGYAVESLTNASIRNGDLKSSLPEGATVSVQATRGHTRPDVVVKDSEGSDVGWFDITASRSEMHIQSKTGSGWRTRPYVAEVTYPSLDQDTLLPLVKATLDKLSTADIETLAAAVQENKAKQEQRLESAWTLVQSAIQSVASINNTATRRAAFETELARLFGITDNEKLPPATAKGVLGLVTSRSGSNFGTLARQAGYGTGYQTGRDTEAALGLIYHL